MRIDQTTPARQLPTLAAPPEQTLSKTDWKTHALIVLSYLLVGVGIALAFCAPYIAFTVQPMLAVASPVLPIALGVLGLQYSSEPIAAVKVAAPVKPSNIAVVPPIGIDREGNNCWVNASLQLLFNVPGFRKLIENLDNPSDPLLSKLKNAFEIYKQGGKVISQEIRKLLPNLNAKIDPSSEFPDDPIEFLDPLLKKLGYPPLKEYGQCIRREGGRIISVTPLINNDNPVYFDLGSNYNIKRKRMTNVLDNHFNYTIDNVNDKNIIINTDKFLCFLEEIPDDFSTVIHPGFNEKSGKREDKVVEEAMQVSISDQNRYFCDSFITHSGSTPQNGHYISYLYKDGNWWEANDGEVNSIDLEKANRLIKTAYFRHYTNSSLPPEKMKGFSPVGIPNAGANCWANTILQFIANAPSIANQILSQRNDQCQPIASLILNYYEAQLWGKKVAENVDSQLLRESIENVSKDKWTQIDVSEGIENIFGKAGIKYEMVQDIRSKNGLSTSRQNVYMIDLDLVTSARSFKELFAGFFYTKLDDGQTKQLKFVQPPKDLIIKTLRYGQPNGKDPSSAHRIEDAITGLPDQFELPRHLTQGNEPNIHYELVGCMIQKGALDSGHYITLVKKPNGWYLNDDSRVRKIDDTKAKEELKKGYFFNYRKVRKTAVAT